MTLTPYPQIAAKAAPTSVFGVRRVPIPAVGAALAAIKTIGGMVDVKSRRSSDRNPYPEINPDIVAAAELSGNTSRSTCPLASPADVLS